MKKKILLMLSMVAVLACIFALAVSAESAHIGNVDLNAKVVLDDTTECPLFDEDGDALVWYISGTDESGANIYSSLKTQDPRVQWIAQSWGEVTDVKIVDGETTYSKNTFVVVNMMDDDVKSNTPNDGKHTAINRDITGFKYLFEGCKNLEYCYLRLDTTGIFSRSFNGCSKLKYVNLENLTKLSRIGDGGNFAGCKMLFKDQVLDLTRTKLTSIDRNSSTGGSFVDVPFVGIKLPNTVRSISSYTFERTGLTSFVLPTGTKVIEENVFKDCSSLTSVYLHNSLTKIGANAFLNCNALENIFYVGSNEQLDELLPYVISDDGKATHVSGVSTTGNDPFWDALNANRISYVEYQLLDDKSEKCVVYGYSYCEAYNNSECALSGNSTMLEADYFKGVFFVDTCTAENCKACVVDKSKTIGAIFVDCGYSVTEEPINGKHSMVQCYKRNQEAYDKYVALRDSFEFGVVVSVAADPLSEENSSLIETKQTYITKQNFIAHDYFDVGVSGIGENQTEISLVFCAYIIDNGEYFYLDGGETVKVATAKSHGDLAPKAE